MSTVIDLSKRFNHRWKTDPLFVKGFDYDHPKYANVPDDCKWMLPMHEQQKDPRVRAEARRITELGRQQARAEIKAKRRQRLTVISPSTEQT